MGRDPSSVESPVKQRSKYEKDGETAILIALFFSLTLLSVFYVFRNIYQSHVAFLKAWVGLLGSRWQKLYLQCVIPSRLQNCVKEKEEFSKVGLNFTFSR